MAKLLILLLLIATAIAVLSAPSQDENSPHHLDNGSQLDNEKFHFPLLTCGTSNGNSFATIVCMAFCQTVNQTSGNCDNGECLCI